MSVQVAPSQNGRFESKSDVVGMHFERQRLIHVECSVNILSMAKPEKRISLKFKRGCRFIEKVFDGITTLATLKRVVIFQFSNTSVKTIGTARIIQGRAARMRQAAARASDLAPVMTDLRATGASTLVALAESLNKFGILASRGGAWSSTQVKG